MRKYRIGASMIAIMLCTNAHSHVMSSRPCPDDTVFSPIVSTMIKPAELQQAYIDYMHANGFPLCSLDGSGNPNTESCGGVDAMHFSMRSAQEYCQKLSMTEGIPLQYVVSFAPSFSDREESDHDEHSFAHTLYISCGVCTTTDVPPI